MLDSARPPKPLAVAFAMFWVVLLPVVTPRAGTVLAQAQDARALSEVKKIYVEPLGHGKLGEEFRDRVIARLRKSGRFDIVESPDRADAVMAGTAEIWVTGHISLSPRSPSTQQAVYSGFLSASVRSKDNQFLWSYLVTPRKFAWGGIVHDLADNLASKLLEAREERNESASPSPTTATITLHGAGATFPAPLYQKWFQSFKEQKPSQHITYDAVGSEDGIQELTEGKADFAASDMPLSDERTAETNPMSPESAATAEPGTDRVR